MVYPTITDNFNLDILNANFLELYNQTNTSSNVAIPPNKILAMPTKPTYSGDVVTVYAGTKVSMPNGRNADGTVNNIIFSLANDLTYTATCDGTPRFFFLRENGDVSNIIIARFYVCNFANRPTTVPVTGACLMYCPDTNLNYSTIGSTAADWVVNSARAFLGEVYTNTTSITSMTIYDVYNIGQEIDKINVMQSYTPTASNLGTITNHTAMVKSGMGRYKLNALSGTWTANTNYAVCTLSSIYRPTIAVDKKIIIRVDGSTGVVANFYIGTDGNVVIKPHTAITSSTIQIDEIYII